MLEICRFFGMIIRMMFDDHAPPHFHVMYNEFEAMIGIADLRLLEGDLPPKAFALVMEWAKMHQAELLKDWELAKSQQQIFKIDPLK